MKWPAVNEVHNDIGSGKATDIPERASQRRNCDCKCSDKKCKAQADNKAKEQSFLYVFPVHGLENDVEEDDESNDNPDATRYIRGANLAITPTIVVVDELPRLFT